MLEFVAVIMSNTVTSTLWLVTNQGSRSGCQVHRRQCSDNLCGLICDSGRVPVTGNVSHALELTHCFMMARHHYGLGRFISSWDNRIPRAAMLAIGRST